MELAASNWVKEKILNDHQIEFIEVEEAFFCHGDKYVIDDRAKNKTNPPTVWFIGETFEGRLIKVVIIPYTDKNMAVLRTAYEPDAEEIKSYENAK